MSILSNVVLFLAILVAVVFSLLVLLTGKGDAMSGGGSVRTSYKGKATFDDIMSRAALYLGVSFMGLVLLYNVLSARVRNAEDMAGITPPVSSPSNPPAASNNAPVVSNNAPAANAPAASDNAPVASNNAPAASNNAPVASNNAPTSTPASNNAPASNAPASNAPANNTPAANNAPKK